MCYAYVLIPTCLQNCANTPQIDYSTVFFFEYLGPMLIYPLFFLLPSVFYGQ